MSNGKAGLGILAELGDDSENEEDSMKKAEAYEGFRYHGDRIYSPLGNRQPRHESMRIRWAHAIDNGCYRRLPTDAVEADRALNTSNCPICGHTFEEY